MTRARELVTVACGGLRQVCRSTSGLKRVEAEGRVDEMG